MRALVVCALIVSIGTWLGLHGLMSKGRPDALSALNVEGSPRNNVVLRSPWANADLRVSPTLLVHCAAWKAATSDGGNPSGLGPVADRARAILATDPSESGKVTWLYVAAILTILDDQVSTRERIDVLRSWFHRSSRDDENIDLTGYLVALSQTLDAQRASWCAQAADMDLIANTVVADLGLRWPAALEFIASTYVDAAPQNPTITCYVVEELPFEGGVNVLVPHSNGRRESVPTIILGTVSPDLQSPSSVLMHEFVHVMDAFYHRPFLHKAGSGLHVPDQRQQWQRAQLEHVIVGAEGSLALRHVGLTPTGYWADPMAVCEVYSSGTRVVSNEDVVCVYDAWQAYRNGGVLDDVELLLRSLMVID